MKVFIGKSDNRKVQVVVRHCSGVLSVSSEELGKGLKQTQKLQKKIKLIILLPTKLKHNPKLVFSPTLATPSLPFALLIIMFGI